MTRKTPAEIATMRASGRILARVMREVSAMIEPGITPKTLNDAAHKMIEAAGATPSFYKYRGFPAAACISVNQVVVHGIPNEVPLKEGDICSLDFGVHYQGYHTDSAWTFPVGRISPQAERLLRVTEESLWEGIEQARPGRKLGDIGATVQQHVEKAGFHVVRDLVGHGIGRNLHEEPNVPNFGKYGKGATLSSGITLCIEPMVNAGTWKVIQLEDGWTIETADHGLSAHFEHTVAITDDGPEILTKED